MSSNSGTKQQRRKSVPDVLGGAGRVRVLATLLERAQAQRFEYEAIQVANGHRPDDPVSGLPALRDDGTVQSYRLLIGECDAQIDRLRETYPDAWREVMRLVKERDEALSPSS